MKKSKEKKNKTPDKKASVPQSAKDERQQDKTDDAVSELFGVHIISERDIENHFGTPESEANAEARRERASSDESKTGK